MLAASSFGVVPRINRVEEAHPVLRRPDTTPMKRPTRHTFPRGHFPRISGAVCRFFPAFTTESRFSYDARLMSIQGKYGAHNIIHGRSDGGVVDVFTQSTALKASLTGRKTFDHTTPPGSPVGAVR